MSADEHSLNREPEPGTIESLPPELSGLGKNLASLLNDEAQVPQAFSAFCAAAYAKPEWAGAASLFLATLFADKEDLLAEMARIPDLIIELAAGSYAFTFMVASRWAERGDTARLVRLAEAMVAAHSKMAVPEGVDLMLALATSLAITRYQRAEQLLAVAEPQAGDDHAESLAEARLWMSAGRLVRASSQDERDLWDYRLRRRRNAWTWQSEDERRALIHLAEQIDLREEGTRLFQEIVPACWWDLVCQRAQESANEPAASVASAPPPLPETPPLAPLPPPPAATTPPISQPATFFIGGLVGAWALAFGIWLSPFDLIRQGNEPTTAVGSREPEPAEHPNSQWRRKEATALREQVPNLQRYAEEVERGGWDSSKALLQGETDVLPKDSEPYEQFLRLLHLDPPSDAGVRAKIPSLLADLKAGSDLLDLWEKLVYPGSANAREIQQAAQRQHHDNAEAWSPAQRARLNRIGWELLPPAP